MHELSIATNLIQLIEQEQRRHGFEHVARINLKVGHFSSVVPEALQMAFEIASKGTVAEDAELVIEDVPLVLKCNKCGKEFQAEPFLFVCPECNSSDVEILTGNELHIESIEV